MEVTTLSYVTYFGSKLASLFAGSLFNEFLIYETIYLIFIILIVVFVTYLEHAYYRRYFYYNPTWYDIRDIILVSIGIGIFAYHYIYNPDITFTYVIYYYDASRISPSVKLELEKLFPGEIINYQTFKLQFALPSDFVYQGKTYKGIQDYLPLGAVIENIDLYKSILTKHNLILVPENTKADTILCGVIDPIKYRYSILRHSGNPIFYQFVEVTIDSLRIKPAIFKPLSPYIDGTMRLPENFRLVPLGKAWLDDWRWVNVPD